MKKDSDIKKLNPKRKTESLTLDGKNDNPNEEKFFLYKSPKFQKKGQIDLKEITFESLNEIPCAYYGI